MAEEFIEDIYRYSLTIYKLERMVEETRKWLDEKAFRILNEVLPDLYECNKRMLETDPELGKRLWSALQEVLGEGKELLRIADIIELQILPELYLWIQKLSSIDVEDDDGYQLLSSRSGFLTLRYNGYYLHTCGNPLLEAYHLTEDFYDPGARVYYIYGCGLGYHVYQIAQMLLDYGRIVLYEPDERVLQYARQYGILSWVPEEMLTIGTYTSAESFFREAEERKAGLFVFVHGAHACPDKMQKKVAIEKWIRQNSTRWMKEQASANRVRNRLLQLPDVSLFIDKMHYDEAVVVAAGPSLNDHWELIRTWSETKMIIAVGTVYHKFLRQQIYPDAVVAIDYAAVTFQQFQGIEDTQTPLIISQDAYWKVAACHKGPAYCIYKDTEGDLAQWKSGGTVAFTAIDLAIKTRPQTIYLIGLDLGYPDKAKYAEGIAGGNQMDTFKLFPVSAVNGGNVMTDIHMDSYRRNIESLISQTSGIRFYNLSRQGALIKGAQSLYQE